MRIKENNLLRKNIQRKILQVAAFGFTNSHVGNIATGRIYKGYWKNFCSPGLNCYSCPAAGLSCPIGAMQAVENTPRFGVSFYVLGFILAIGVIFGRAICGYVCPFGLIQEIFHKIPSPKKHLPKPFTYIKYLLLIVFVVLLPALLNDSYGIGSPAFCKYICPAGTLEGGLPILFTHPELRKKLGGIFSIKAAILILTIVGCIICCRFFCKVMCPLGAIYGLLNKISFCRIHVEKERCVSCGACHAICPMDVNPVRQPQSAECIRCGKCAAVCQEHVISVRFTGNSSPN